MQKLRVGQIGGTRGFGSRRCQTFHEHPRAQVVALAARDKQQVEEAASKIDAKPYTDWHDVLTDPRVDAVGVATPSAFHFEMAKAALEAGKHTIVEYPICQTLEELDELQAIAEAKGVVLHHGLTVRGEALHLKLKELAPRLGRLFHAHYRYFGTSKWYVDEAIRGDAFMTLHIHFLDQFEDIVGEQAVRLNATLKVLQDGETHIHSGATVQQFACGATAIQEFGMGFSAKPSYSGWYIGEHGWLGFEGRDAVTLELADGAKESHTPDSIDTVANDTDNFIAQVLDGADSWVPDRQTRRAMRLCLAAAESALTGLTVDVASAG